MSSLFIGCGGLDFLRQATPQQTGAGGVVAGAAAVKIQEKAVEIFSPKYPLYMQGVELCVLGKVVTCSLVPCNENCEISVPFDIFVQQNPKVATLRTSVKQLNAVNEFCKENEDACIEQLYAYDGEKIVVEAVDE